MTSSDLDPHSSEACGCGCASVNVFGTREAEDDLRSYRKKGPGPTTAALIEAIIAEGVEGATLLDIGAGVGAIQLGLLPAGVARAEFVDASEAYVAVAREEAAQRGFGERTTGHVGDFVALANEVPPADIVTLERVVCCYGDVAALLTAATQHAGRMIGLVYPPPTPLMRIFGRIGNVLARLFRQQCRFYIHPLAAIEEPLRAAGFVGRPIKRTLVWQVALYTRS
jgi:methyltransferase family protein